MSDFTNTRHPKARGKHQCAWCAEYIVIGERHVHVSGVWQDEWQDWRMHSECYEAADQENALVEGFCFHDGQRPVAPKDVAHD